MQPYYPKLTLTSTTTRSLVPKSSSAPHSSSAFSAPHNDNPDDPATTLHVPRADPPATLRVPRADPPATLRVPRASKVIIKQKKKTKTKAAEPKIHAKKLKVFFLLFFLVRFTNDRFLC